MRPDLPHAATALQTADFRKVLGRFCSGVTIITARDGEGLIGLTCQSFFSVSLDPPLVAFSPARTSQSYARMRSCNAFCINILAEDQHEVCEAFARSGTDKWAGVAWRPGVTGSPIIDGALAWIDCQWEVEHPAGDHYLTLGRVIELRHDPAKGPLLFYGGAFASLAV